MSMLGFFFSNWATCALNCWTAAAELPGMSDATLIVTVFAPDAPAAVTLAAKRHATAARTNAGLRVDFIVLLLSIRLGGAKRWCPGPPHRARGHCWRSGRRGPAAAGSVPGRS